MKTQDLKISINPDMTIGDIKKLQMDIISLNKKKLVRMPVKSNSTYPKLEVYY